jgi:hypothetical protein
MQTLVRYYVTESTFDWVSHLPMVEFKYNRSSNEASKHSPFEASYGFQPITLDDRSLPQTDAPAYIADRLTT